MSNLFKHATQIQKMFRMVSKRKKFFQTQIASKKIQKAFRNCNKELFYLRKHKHYCEQFIFGGEILCPIGLTTIKKAVLFHGHLYEHENLIRWLKNNPVCPLTKKKGGTVVHLRDIPDYIEYISNLNDYLFQETEYLGQQMRSLNDTNKLLILQNKLLKQKIDYFEVNSNSNSKKIDKSDNLS